MKRSLRRRDPLHFCTSSAALLSSPLVGSSSRTTAGRETRATPMLMRRRCPPDTPRRRLLPPPIMVLRQPCAPGGVIVHASVCWRRLFAAARASGRAEEVIRQEVLWERGGPPQPPLCMQALEKHPAPGAPAPQAPP